MSENVFERQMGTFDPRSYTGKVYIIGCGSVGSITGQLLVRMGFSKFELIDFDVVETHNISNQTFELEDIGKLKVEALMEKMIRDSPVPDKIEIFPKPERYKYNHFNDSTHNDIFILALDNMKTRLKIVEDLIKRREYLVNETDVTPKFILIDPRMSREAWTILTLTDLGEYQKYFYTDAQADDEVCTNRTILYTVYDVASKIARNIVYTLKGLPVDKLIMGDEVNLHLIKKKEVKK